MGRGKESVPVVSETAGPVVSVMMPFFNSERFLTEAVESVAAQSYPSWELLLVNDGSTDGGGDIARSYMRSDPARFRYLEHPNGANLGDMASRTLALEASRGRFVARVDSDDVLLPGALEQAVGLLERYPEASMAYAPLQIWNSWRGGEDVLQCLTVPRNIPLDPPAVLEALLVSGTDEPCHIIARRTALNEVRGYSDIAGLYEDIALSVKLCAASPVIASDQVWVRYRQHDDSLCGRSRPELMDLACLAFLTWTEKYLNTRQLDTPSIVQVVAERRRSLEASIEAAGLSIASVETMTPEELEATGITRAVLGTVPAREIRRSPTPDPRQGSLR